MMQKKDLSNNAYLIKIAGIEISCFFSYSDTYKYFGNYFEKIVNDRKGISVIPEEWDYWGKLGNKPGPKGEYSLMTSVISDELLKYNRCIIHAVAFSYNDKAWLIVGPSGIGKSTQIKTLKQLYPEDFTIICGDRPVLESRTDGTIYVHPSPWNGKEGWSGTKGSTLAGILCLERGESTVLEKYTQKEAVIPIFISLISNMQDAETIHRLEKMENAILKACSVYRYVNGGIPESSKLIYERLFGGMNKNEL